jgi:TetR/AcrR family transcriptional regulator, transcriptional repressor for nem operon
MDETRERILYAAMKLFAEKGYQSTSVADILKEAGAHSGSLYHFFPTKQDVLIAVLGLYRDGIVPMLLAPAWYGVDDPIERVFALLAAYRGMLASTDCLYGCPIGSIALELHEPDPAVRELLSINFHGWVEQVKSCLDAARLSGDTRQLATFVLTVMEGGVMQSRTHRNLDAFDAGVASLRDYFTRLAASDKGERYG